MANQDQADLAQEYELQNINESEKRRDSYVEAAGAAGGLVIGPPRRLIRSYDRQIVDDYVLPPSSFSENDSRAGVMSRQQLNVACQQSAACGNDSGQSGHVSASYNQSQQQAVQQPMTIAVVTLPADCQLVQTTESCRCPTTIVWVAIVVCMVLIVMGTVNIGLMLVGIL